MRAAGMAGIVLGACVLLLGCSKAPPPAACLQGDGHCVCPDSGVRCGATCVDPLEDPDHCGASGECQGEQAGWACAEGTACEGGLCACPEGQVYCGTECIDPLTSLEHCGAALNCRGVNAGTACEGDLGCQRGVCSCAPGLVACRDSCIDPRESLTHCGASGDCLGARAGAACAEGEACIEGTCLCRDDGVRCGGACINPRTSAAFCGASGDCQGDRAGEICDPRASCTEGTCVCPQEEVHCEGACIDPKRDGSHCGASGDCRAENAGSTCGPEEMCWGAECVSAQPLLVSLGLSAGQLSPAFVPEQWTYVVSVGAAIDAMQVIPTAASRVATIEVNGVPTTSGASSAPVALALGTSTAIQVVVRIEGQAPVTYDILVQRAAIAYVKPSNKGGLFHVVALSADTLAVGAPREASGASGVDGDQEDQSAPDSGAVYVFVRDGEGWVQQAYLKPSNNRPGERYGQWFGASLALYGDTLAVGSPSEDSSAKGIDGDQQNQGAQNSGAVYVFTRQDGVWSQQAYVKPSNTSSGQIFGASVALSGNTLVVGSPQESSGAAGIDGNQNDTSLPESGAAYVFTWEGGVWAQQAYVKSSSPRYGAQFGAAVSIDGDILAVGAFRDGDYSTDGDAAYVFRRNGGRWSEEARLVASNRLVMRRFGIAFGLHVSVSGEIMAVGAPNESSGSTGIDGDQDDTGAVYSGAVYLFRNRPEGWVQEAYIKASNTKSGAWFGSSVALLGDLLAVGSTGEGGGAAGINGDQLAAGESFSGAAYLFQRVNGAWAQRSYIKATQPGKDQQFGASVSLHGTTLAVGVPGDDSTPPAVNGITGGAVYVY